MLSFPRQINNYTELSTKSIAFGLHTYTRRYDTKANIACPAVHLKNFIAKHYGEVILKFIYSEKAIHFYEISIADLSYVVTVKSKVEIAQNCVAFSEYMNFTHIFKEKSHLQGKAVWTGPNDAFFSLRLWKKNWHVQLVNVDSTYLLNEESYKSCLI